MILSLKSNNPNLSWVISKNPESGPLGRNIRRGAGLGWFKDGSEYVCAFLECVRSTGNVSFGRNPDDDFHMLYAEEYCDPYVAISLINEYFRDLVNKDRQEKDVESDNSLTITSLRVNNFAKKIDRFMPVNYSVKSQSKDWDKYQVVEFQNRGTVKDLICNVSLYLLFLSLAERQSIDISPELIHRYIKILNEQNLPYYPRSLFKLKAHSTKKEFLDLLNTDSISLCPWDTHRARIEFTVGNTAEGGVTLDLGCGEDWAHGKRLAKKSVKYIGVDIDKDALEAAEKKAERNHVDNAEFYLSIDDIPDQEIDTLVCSEVIEHCSTPRDAQELILQVIKRFSPKKILLTTVNSSFNVNYLFEEGQMRHDDHKFELTKNEFIAFCAGFIQYELEFVGVGDCVNGEYCSSGAILTRK